jgi:hypothetical protein
LFAAVFGDLVRAHGGFQTQLIRRSLTVPRGLTVECQLTDSRVGQLTRIAVSSQAGGVRAGRGALTCCAASKRVQMDPLHIG